MSKNCEGPRIYHIPLPGTTTDDFIRFQFVTKAEYDEYRRNKREEEYGPINTRESEEEL